MDAGNWSPGAEGEDAWPKSSALLQGFARLGAWAVNVGTDELRSDIHRILDEARRLEVPLVSASLVGPDGRPILPPARVVRVGGRELFGLALSGRRVAFIGVTAHRPSLSAGAPEAAVRTRPVGEAVSEGLRQAREGGASDVVLLAALPREDIEGLIRQHPDIDVAVGALGTGIDHRRIGTALLVLPGARGKTVLELAAGDRGAGGLDVRLRAHLLDRRYPAGDDLAELEKETARAVNRVHRERALRGLGATREGLPSHAGASTCRPCHVADYLTWETSGHARALRALADVDADFHPECVPCHVTGAGRVGGFRDAAATPELGGVQCEACHGPCRDHVANAGRVPPAEKASFDCRRCHDEANSPGFDLQAAWPRIRHGSSTP